MLKNNNPVKKKKKKNELFNFLEDLFLGKWLLIIELLVIFKIKHISFKLKAYLKIYTNIF